MSFPTAPIEHLWTAEQVASYLKVHPKTVGVWTRSNALPSVKLGKIRRYEPSEIRRWVAENREATA